MCILSTLCNEGKSHVFIYLIPLDESFIVETYFPVYHFKLILQNLVIILITLVNESDRDYLFITRLQYTVVI
jgi:hypothetical protein